MVSFETFFIRSFCLESYFIIIIIIIVIIIIIIIMFHKALSSTENKSVLSATSDFCRWIIRDISDEIDTKISLPLCSGGRPSSFLEWNPGYPYRCLRGLLQSCRTDGGVMPVIRPQLPFSTCFRFHHSFILMFKVKQIGLLAATLKNNK
jgi:hypothetical protein